MPNFNEIYFFGRGLKFQYFFDLFPSVNLKFAYSLIKLSSTYSGDCIRVRRSSDDAELDIGFLNNRVDTVALLTFVGAGNGFVVKWYDQSSNGIDTICNILVNQPKIVSSGVVELINGLPAIYGNNSFLSSSTFTSLLETTLITVISPVTNTGIFGNLASSNFAPAFQYGANGIRAYRNGASFTPFNNKSGNQLIYFQSGGGSDWLYYTNDDEVINSGQDIGNAIADRVQLFSRTNTGSFTNQRMSLYIYYNENMNSHRIAMQNYINDIYGIF